MHGKTVNRRLLLVVICIAVIVTVAGCGSSGTTVARRKAAVAATSSPREVAITGAPLALSGLLSQIDSTLATASGSGQYSPQPCVIDGTNGAVIDVIGDGAPAICAVGSGPIDSEGGVTWRGTQATSSPVAGNACGFTSTQLQETFVTVGGTSYAQTEAVCAAFNADQNWTLKYNFNSLPRSATANGRSGSTGDTASTTRASGSTGPTASYCEDGGCETVHCPPTDPSKVWICATSQNPAARAAVAHVSGGSGNKSTSTLPHHCSSGVNTTDSISCGLASNVFYEYYRATHSGPGSRTLSAWSAATTRYYPASCSLALGLVRCRISGTTDPNAEVEISRSVLNAYTPQDASALRGEREGWSERLMDHNSQSPDAGHLVKRSLEGGAAMYALEHASRGTPIGQEGGIAAQAARTGGNFVIAGVLWHFLIVPYLAVTGVVFAIPSLILAFIAGSDHSAALWWITAIVFVCSFGLWVRYALYKWLWRKFVRPVDRSLSGWVASSEAPNGNQRAGGNATLGVQEQVWANTAAAEDLMLQAQKAIESANAANTNEVPDDLLEAIQALTRKVAAQNAELAKADPQTWARANPQSPAPSDPSSNRDVYRRVVTEPQWIETSGRRQLVRLTSGPTHPGSDITSKHVHIAVDGQVIGTVFLDRNGKAVDDGSIPAVNAIHDMPHSIDPEHGERVLDAIVQGLDHATLVAAYQCEDAACVSMRRRTGS